MKLILPAFSKSLICQRLRDGDSSMSYSEIGKVSIENSVISVVNRPPIQRKIRKVWRSLAPAGVFFGEGGSEVQKGRACKGVTVLGVPGAEPPDAGEVFKKFIKQSIKNLQFLKKFSKKFRDCFQMFLKFYRNFGENLEKNIENLKLCICCRGFGGLNPRR